MGLESPLITLKQPIVVANEGHRFLVSEQLREVSLNRSRVLLEPEGRNTAPALTLAAMMAQAEGSDPILVVTPADQTVADLEAFRRAMLMAIESANANQVVILGIPPDRPETGYGYIEVTAGDGQVTPVVRFVEKPNAEVAASYLASGRHLWNAGIFVLKASVWLAALQKFRPDMLAAVKTSWADHSRDGQFIRPEPASFRDTPSESIDYAVMEHLPGSGFPISVVRLDAGWSDLGAWDAVWKALPRDAQGNASTGDVLSLDCRNTLVHSNHRLVGVVGLDDVVVVETADAVLVAHRTQSQQVGALVKALGERGREERQLHRKVHRPWGWYDSIDEGDRFKVKRILVNPKASLSLQKHHHRAEHWVVVRGTAEITNGEHTLLLSENQSTYIPLGQLHRLSNPGSIPLELIEVQSGSYLGEDDIVRIDDQYGRRSTS